MCLVYESVLTSCCVVFHQICPNSCELSLINRIGNKGLYQAPSPLTSPSLICFVLWCPLQVKLMKYICKQLQCKQKVPDTERPSALDSYPRLVDWLRTINIRPELIEVMCVCVC